MKKKNSSSTQGVVDCLITYISKNNCEVSNFMLIFLSSVDSSLNGELHECNKTVDVKHLSFADFVLAYIIEQVSRMWQHF